MEGIKKTMTSLLLINEPPLQLLPALAEVVGLNEAIILQQIHYWISFKYNNNVFKERKWVYNTYDQWRAQFPFWHKSTIERTIIRLEKKKILLSREGERRLKHYTIDYEALNAAFEESIKTKKASENQGSDPITANCRDPISRQIDETVTAICRDGHGKLPRSLYIDTETTQRLHREREVRVEETYEPTKDSMSVLKKNAPLTKAVSRNSRQGEETPKEKKNGSTLDINWTLPDKWREWSIQCGMMNEEIDMIELKFRNYWLSTTKNSTKKDWFMTWQNWCVGECERKGLRLKVKNTVSQEKIPFLQSISTKIKFSNDPHIQKWNELQPMLIDRIGLPDYESWFEKRLELVKADSKAIFKASSTFIRDYVRFRYLSDIAAVLREIDPKLGIELNIEFVTEEGYINPFPEGALER